MINDFVLKTKALFPPSRIITLLHYKSKILCNEVSSQSKSHMYLLLDFYEPTDISKLSQLAGLSFEFENEYFDDIKNRDKYNFHLGCYRSFYTLILANADTLIGKNVFRDKLVKIDNLKLKNSLLVQIEEHFWILEACIIKAMRSSAVIPKLKKSFIIIIAHILLLREGFPCINVFDYEYENVVKEAITKKYFSNSTKSRLKDIFLDEVSLPILYGEAKRFLYLDYVKISSNIKAF